MALTEVVRLRLEAKGFNKLYEDHREEWVDLAEGARKLIADRMPTGHKPTVDDIKKVLEPLIEINPRLREFLAGGQGGRKPLTQQYWVRDFTDYVLHNVYEPKLNIP